jgi:hypothetical protein
MHANRCWRSKYERDFLGTKLDRHEQLAAMLMNTSAGSLRKHRTRPVALQQDAMHLTGHGSNSKLKDSYAYIPAIHNKRGSAECVHIQHAPASGWKSERNTMLET